MAGQIAINFALNAAFGSGFKGVFAGAQNSIKQVAGAIAGLENSPMGKLGAAMQAQKAKIKDLAEELSTARTALSGLQNAGGSGLVFTRQVELAEQKVKSLTNALNQQKSALVNTAAQAANSGTSLQGLSNHYTELTRNIERARNAQASLAANQAQRANLSSQRGGIAADAGKLAAGAMTVAAPAKLAIDFEDQMAKVAAVAQADDKALAQLTATARQLGRDTTFSASQAAQGMQYLSMAGFKTEQIISAMPGMLDLAAASGTDLGRTADIASNVLSQFNLKASDMGHVGDVLVQTFTTSNTSLESLGETFKYLGPIASEAGVKIEEAAAMVGLLGNYGIQGSEGGTAARAALTRLQAPPTEAAKALTLLNVATQDAQGNMRPVVEIMEELAVKMSKLGSAEKSGLLKDIFGMEAMGPMSKLLTEAVKTVDADGNQILDKANHVTTSIRQFAEKNAASSQLNADGLTLSQQVAKRMNDTTGGALRSLGSAWEEVGISVGNLFTPVIRTAADALKGVGNTISGFINNFPGLSKGVAFAASGFGGLMAASIAFRFALNMTRTGVLAFRGVLLTMRAAQIACAASTYAIAGAQTAFAGASKVAALAARIFSGGLRSIMLASGIGAVLVGLTIGIKALIDNWDSVVAAMKNAWNWVKNTWSQCGQFFSNLGQSISGIFQGVWQGVVNVFAWAGQTALNIWNGVVNFFTSIFGGISGTASTILQGVVNIFSWAGQNAQMMWQTVVDFFGGIFNSILQAGSTLWGYISGFASECVDSVKSVWNDVTDFFQGIVDGIVNVFQRCFDWLKEKFAWVMSTIDNIKGAVNSVMNFFSGDDEEKKPADSAAAAEKSLPAATAAKNEPVAQAAANSQKNPVAKAQKQTGAAPSIEMNNPKITMPAATGAPENPAVKNQQAAQLPNEKYKAMSRDEFLAKKAAMEAGKGKSGGGGSKSRGGGGAKSGKKEDEGPVHTFTIGDNGQIQSFPSAANGARTSMSSTAMSGTAMSNRTAMSASSKGDLFGSLANNIFGGISGVVTSAAAVAKSGMNAMTGDKVLPQSPAIAKREIARMKGEQGGANSINVDVKQNFALMGDADKIRQVMEQLKPDFEALVRKALANLQSNKSRTAYVQ